MIDLKEVKDIPDLVRKAKWLEGKTLAQISEDIAKSDATSRVTTKGNVGYVIENFFGINKNSHGRADIHSLGVEIKTCPLKYNADHTRLSVKEPLSLNIINYSEECKCKDLDESSLYKKNRRILFIFYIHEPEKDRSEYLVKYVFLWEMDSRVLEELGPDYSLIMEKVRSGLAHEIHEEEHEWLTLCPKHGGDFNDPDDKKSRRRQPFSEVPAEVRAFRLKSRYIVHIICRYLRKTPGLGGWEVWPV